VAVSDGRLLGFEQGGRLNLRTSSGPAITSGPVVGQPLGDSPAVAVFVTADGMIHWVHATQETVPLHSPVEVGSVEAPLLLAGKTVVVATTEGFLYAFDLEGSLLWQYPPTQPVEAGFHSAPALAGDTVLVVDGDGLLHAVSLENGKPRCPDPIRLPGRIVSHPAIVGGAVFVRTELGTIHAIDHAGCNGLLPPLGHSVSYPTQPVSAEMAPASDGRTLYVVEGRRLIALTIDASAWSDVAGEFASPWEGPFVVEDPVTTPPVVAAGVVYFGTEGGLIFGVDANTGKDLWNGGFRVGSGVRGEVVVVARAAFVTTAEGQLWAIAGQ
jgi:outer membrane protein assembly factor BamB